MALALILLGFGFLLSGADAADPGVKGRLTLKGLQYAWQVGLEEMHKKVETVHIPDVSGSVSVAVLGRMSYSVTQLRVRTLDLSSSDISFSPATGVGVSINDGRVSVTGLLGIHTWLFSASSWLEISVQGLTVQGVLGITCDDSGHGAVWDAECNSYARYVNLEFHGGAGWLFNMFKDSIMGPIHEALHTRICSEFSKAVKHMETILSTFPVSLAVDLVSSIDISLLGPPNITEKSFDVLVKGEFVGRYQHWDLPFPLEKLILPDVDSRMVLLALSQFTANSAAYVHYKAGALRVNITDDMIPQRSPVHLNVRSLAMFVPELPSHFPDSSLIVLQVSARSAPTVSCQPDSLTVQVSADVMAFVTYPNQTQIPIFQIQADSVTKVDVVLSKEAMGATIEVKNFSLKLINSSVGPVKMDSLKNTLSFGLRLLTPVLNERLRKMFPLPPQLQLQDPIISVRKGFLILMTDLQVTPLSRRYLRPENCLYSERFTAL